MPGGVKVFISYAHKDAKLSAELLEHLGALRQEEIIDTWIDRAIPPGADWNKEIVGALDGADLILLLISPAFLDSEFCYSIEMKRAMARREAGTASVIPIILEDCYWKPAPFAKFQALPEGLTPLSTLSKRRKGTVYAQMVAAIHKVVKNIAAGKSRGQGPTEPPPFRPYDVRLAGLHGQLAAALERSAEAIGALNAVTSGRGLTATIDARDLQGAAAWLTQLPFEAALGVLQDALRSLERGNRRDGVAAVRTAARHLIPMLFVAGQGMADTRKRWEVVGDGAVIALPAGHETFAEIVAAGLDLRAAGFASTVKDPDCWPRGCRAVSDQPPGGLSDGFERNLREDLWNKVKPPNYPGTPSSAQKDAAINKQLRTFAEKRGVRFYMICNDQSGPPDTISRTYPDLAVIALDPALYDLHQGLFNDIRDLLSE
jgi:hypothetical protein